MGFVFIPVLKIKTLLFRDRICPYPQSKTKYFNLIFRLGKGTDPVYEM
jgi:hypothetical protein